ncbi:MAG: hypothetical protein WCL18_09000 [bacterium]
MNTNYLNTQLLINTQEDPIKIVLESMDMRLGGITKAKETTQENIATDTNIVHTNTEVITTNTNVITTDTQILATNTDIVTESVDTKKRIAKREATQQAYNDLDDKNKITDAQLQKEKANIPQIVIDAVNKKTQGTDFKADEFLKFYLIGENKDNKGKAEYKDFMTKYVELKKELEIPEIVSFSEASKAKNIDNIIEANK